MEHLKGRFGDLDTFNRFIMLLPVKGEEMNGVRWVERGPDLFLCKCLDGVPGALSNCLRISMG